MPRLPLLTALTSLLALPLLASAHEYSTNTTACTRHYTVQDGDTCDIIGQKTFTSTYQVLAYNLPKAGKDCYTLENGAVSAETGQGETCAL